MSLVRRIDTLTPQQRLAVEERAASVVLSSGAGCGKTHVLTSRYLAHLRDDGVTVSQLVAITFTERAARQMRERIRRAVRAEVATAADADGRARWRGHLRDLETADVNTIHAFCQSLLRQFAAQAGLDPGFEVLEEDLAANLRNEALRATLRVMVTAQDADGEALRRLTVDYGWREVLRSTRALLREAEPDAWDRWLALEDVDALTERDARRRALLPDWVDYLSATNRAWLGAAQVMRALPADDPVVGERQLLLLDLPTALRDAGDPAEELDRLRELTFAKCFPRTAWADPSASGTVVKAGEAIRKLLDEKVRPLVEHPEGDPCGSLATARHFLRVARAVWADYRARKARAAVLDFADLLNRAHDLLRDVPAARESLQSRYHYVLLDELQDTDPVQMRLVRLLCGAGGLGGNKLFAVGDHKQSIYRFRGADVSLFRELRGTMRREGQLGLTRNFRSQRPILEFVNALCCARLDEYENLESPDPPRHGGHCVEFLWAASDKCGREFLADAGREAEAAAVAERIADLLDDPTPRIWDERAQALRPIRRGDITILSRRMTIASTYERALRDRGIDYYLIGGRAFYAQQEIYDVLNLLRALENPFDAVSLFGVLRSPFGGLRDDTLLFLARHKEGLWRGLSDDALIDTFDQEQQEAVRRARGWLARWRAWKDRLPISELLRRVIADSGYDAALQFEFLGERKLANLWKLIDLAGRFDQSGLFGTVDFIARLNETVKSQPPEEEAATLPESADVVKLMSVHQSKGLEFPVVFLIDAGVGSFQSQQERVRWHRELGAVVQPPADEKALFDRSGWELATKLDELADWRESLRVLYVACTRARDLLVISAGVPSDFGQVPRMGLPPVPPWKADGPWLMALAERFHLVTGAYIGEEPYQPRVHVTAVKPGTGGRRRAERDAPAPDVPTPPPEPPRAGPPPVQSAAAFVRGAEHAVLGDRPLAGHPCAWEDTAHEPDPERARRAVALRRAIARGELPDALRGTEWDSPDTEWLVEWLAPGPDGRVLAGCADAVRGTDVLILGDGPGERALEPLLRAAFGEGARVAWVEA